MRGRPKKPLPCCSEADAIEWLVKALPLCHGIELIRALSPGAVAANQLLDVAYLATLGLVGMALAGRRIDKLLLK